MPNILKIDETLGTKSFICTPKQQEFVFNNARHILFAGGVRAGKTLSSAWKCLLLARMFPDNLILVGRLTYPSLRDTTLATFNDLIQELGWRVEFKAGEQCHVFPNRSRIIYRYLDGFEPRMGLSLGALFIDQIEDIKERIFNTLLTRLDRQMTPTKEPQFKDLVSGYGQSWQRISFATCNPTPIDHWVYKLWRNNFERRLIKHPLHNPRFYLVEASTDSNKENLPSDFFETLADLPQALRDKYQHGIWGGESGMIYADVFNDHLTMIPENTPFPDDAEFYRAFDHGGQADAGCCLFYYYSASPIDGELEVVFFDLYWGEKQTISQHARNILKLWQDLDFHLTLADPQVKHRTQQSTTKEENISLLDVYRANGLYLTPAFRPVFAGIDKVRVWMNVNAKHPHRFLKGPDGKPLMGAPHMYVHRHLWRLIEQIKSGHYSEKKPGALAQTVDDARTAMRFGLASPVSYRGAEPTDKRVFADSLSQVVATELDEMEEGIDESNLDPRYLDTD